MRKTVTPERGPAPGGPYSPAVVANGVVFVSGHGPVGPASGEMPDAVVDQVRQTLTNVQPDLESAGSDL